MHAEHFLFISPKKGGNLAKVAPFSPWSIHIISEIQVKQKRRPNDLLSDFSAFTLWENSQR